MKKWEGDFSCEEVWTLGINMCLIISETGINYSTRYNSKRNLNKSYLFFQTSWMNFNEMGFKLNFGFLASFEVLIVFINEWKIINLCKNKLKIVNHVCKSNFFFFFLFSKKRLIRVFSQLRGWSWEL